MKKGKRIFFLGIIVILLITSILLIGKYNDNKEYYLDLDIVQNDNVNNPVNYEEVLNTIKIEYGNDDIVGILEIENTDYVVPILQGEDNDYYLNHDAYGNSNYMGSIYLDYRVNIDSSRKLLIYGHNSSNIDMPFKILENFYDKDYYDNHKYVDITTSNVKKKYEIFSVYVEPEDFTYMNINFKSEKEYLDHLNKLKSKSMYDTGAILSSDDEILILQTCSTHKDYSNYQKKYLLIILRRV